MLPYFLKSEDLTPLHITTGGPIAISKARVSALIDYHLNAGKEMAYNVTDYNEGGQEGFNEIQTMVRNGVRSGIVHEYLLVSNTADRSNLYVAIRSFVTKIDIQKKKSNWCPCYPEWQENFH